MSEQVLTNLASPPKAGRNKLYRWCDYIELRCITHQDKKFSRDSLAESLEENHDNDADDSLNDVSGDDPEGAEIEEVATTDSDETAKAKDKQEAHAAFCFKHLRWRSMVFGEQWPFVVDEHAQEISLKADLTETHKFYLSLLLSASLKYIPQKRWREITGLFEQASTEVMKRLMPQGAQVHAFGAAESTRYTGHLHDRLTALAKDINGHFFLKKSHFDANDSGDGGLDIVAWHDLGDGRVGMPIAFAQCGCTAEGWPDKMLQASPAHLAGQLVTHHAWSTYYFMPLDLSTETDGKLDWQFLSNFSAAIVIDRLRFMRISEVYKIAQHPITALTYVTEAIAINET